MIFVFKLLFVVIGYRTALWLHVPLLGGVGVGLCVGHVLDYAATMRFSRWRATRYYRARAQKEFDDTFLNSLFLMFGQICASDGVISAREIKVVDDIMMDMLKLNRKSRNKAIAAFKQARTSKVPFQTSAMRYFELYQGHLEMLESTIQLFLQVAASDGPLADPEHRLVNTAATIFGIEPERYAQMRAYYVREESFQSSKPEEPPPPRKNGVVDAYAVLGCDANSSISDIKKQYRKLALDYHPDKIVSKGLPEDFIKFANHKFNTIQQAYERIKTERGFN